MLRRLIRVFLWIKELLKGMTFIEYVIVGAILMILSAIIAPHIMEIDGEVRLITLIESEWQCVASETRTVVYPMQAGKSTIMVPQQEKVCLQYLRRQP